MLSPVRIVLVGTLFPGNIGSVARAMKTMGLTELWLVQPKSFPHREADYMAVSAVDVVHAATTADTLQEAIADCALVIGTSARDRRIQWPIRTPRACAEAIVSDFAEQRVALVFGREDRGLHNDELQRCNWHVSIPTSPDYTSMNLAAAVQVLCYELRIAALTRRSPERIAEPIWDEPLATAGELDRFYRHLEEVLIELEFLDPRAPRQLMRRLRRLFGRIRLDQMEVNILRGILTETQKRLREN